MSHRSQFRDKRVAKGFEIGGPRLSWDRIADLEIEQCRLERARKNGNAIFAEPRYCNCPELIVNGTRRPCPPGHNCGYVHDRSLLVPVAAQRATEQIPGFSVPDAPKWTRLFSSAMDELAAPLLSDAGVTNGSNGNGHVAQFTDDDLASAQATGLFLFGISGQKETDKSDRILSLCHCRVVSKSGRIQMKTPEMTTQ